MLRNIIINFNNTAILAFNPLNSVRFNEDLMNDHKKSSSFLITLSASLALFTIIFS
jgi:hypothetical protein